MNQIDKQLTADEIVAIFKEKGEKYTEKFMDKLKSKKSDKKSEAVNHPTHYCQPGKKECIEQMKEDYGEVITSVFCLTNAYKYLYRAGNKEGNSYEQDIKKARWYWNYVNKEIQRKHIYGDDNNLYALYKHIENQINELETGWKCGEWGTLICKKCGAMISATYYTNDEGCKKIRFCSCCGNDNGEWGG